MFPNGEPKKQLLELPVVNAFSPNDVESKIDLAISVSTIAKMSAALRRTQIFEAWGHLVGEMPPINNAELMRRTKHPEKKIMTLADAHACFRGVNRQYDHDDNGGDVFVYVISTPHTLRWTNAMVCHVDVVEAPTDTLLTVQVRSSESLQPNCDNVWGTITKWEFIGADTENGKFPRNFETRYNELLWSK